MVNKKILVVVMQIINGELQVAEYIVIHKWLIRLTVENATKIRLFWLKLSTD